MILNNYGHRKTVVPYGLMFATLTSTSYPKRSRSYHSNIHRYLIYHLY